jgi:uncharacterized protein (TIGR00369 family)
MTDAEMIEKMNTHAPPALATLGGKFISFDEETGVAEMHFTADASLCHSGNIVQGGFLAGMLDATMAHAVFATLKSLVIVATLEIKVSYLDIARAGPIVARGWVRRMGKTISFLEAELYTNDGTLLSKASSTARIIHRAPGE